VAVIRSQIEPLEVRRLFVVGTAGNDVIDIQSVGGDSRNFYRAVVNGVASEDVMLSGERKIGVDGLGGNDLITISTSLLAYAFVTGGDGNDTIVGGSQGDTLLGQDGDDLIFGKTGRDTIGGGAGNDTLRGGDGIDELRGDEFMPYDPTVTAAGDDMLFGDAGMDQLYGSGGNDLLNGGDDSDFFLGGAGDDQIYGAGGDDQYTFARLDTLTVGVDDPGNDTIDGGDGTDSLEFSAQTRPIYISLDGISNDGNRGETANIVGFEILGGLKLSDGSVIDASGSPVGVTMSRVPPLDDIPGANFATTWIGSGFDDVIDVQTSKPVQADGRGGDDRIITYSANDYLAGGTGDDTISGGYGKDTILGEEGNDSIEGNGGNDRISAGVGDDVVYGDYFDGAPNYGSDTIEGNAGNDVLVGGGNNDVILGEGGRDTIIGGGGNDRLFGGPDDADKILGGSGTDSAAQDDKDIYDSVEVLL